MLRGAHILGVGGGQGAESEGESQICRLLQRANSERIYGAMPDTDSPVLQENSPIRWNLVQFAFISTYSVGYSGLTSFPFYLLTYSGLFLVAFYNLAFLICIPICYVQLKLGSLYRTGIVGVIGSVIPLFKGAGVALLLMTYLRCLVQGVELGYGLFFAFASLIQPFAWSHSYRNATGWRIGIYHSGADRYLNVDVLQKTEHIDHGGTLLWHLVLVLLATWIIIYFCMFRGALWIAKIFYILTPLSLLLLTIVLVYGYECVPTSKNALNLMFLEFNQQKNQKEMDSSEAIKTHLGNPKTWMEALVMHMYSLGLWSGVLPMIGTHLPSKKILLNTAWMLLLLTYGLLPHLVLGAVAPYINPQDFGGYLSALGGIKPGLPLLFVSVANTFARFDLSAFIAFCLYLSFFILELQHLIIHMLAVFEYFLLAIPSTVHRFFHRREYLVATICFSSFLLSLGYACQAGIHLYSIVFSYVDRLIFILIIVTMVPFITAYIKQEFPYFPIERACMTLWFGVASLSSAGLLTYFLSVYVYQVPITGYDQRWAEQLGWCIALAPLILGLGLGMFFAILMGKGSLKERFLQSLAVEGASAETSNCDYDSVDTGDTALNRSPPPSERTARPATDTEVTRVKVMEVCMEAREEEGEPSKV